MNILIKSIKVYLLLVLSCVALTGCDFTAEEYIYQCQVTHLEQLGDGEILPLENSLIWQGVSLNADIVINGEGFDISMAQSNADKKAFDYYEQNLSIINPRDLILIRGKSFNYSLIRYDGPQLNRPVMISTQRITKK